MKPPARARGLAALLGVALAVWIPATAEAAANPAPVTIPALQQWTGGNGTFTLGAAARIVTSAQDANTLDATATLLAADLTSQTGVPVTTATGSPDPGDIVLRLDSIGSPGPTPDAQANAYKLTSDTTMTVTAPTDSGVFNGTRTVLQLLHNSGKSTGQGTATDWPVRSERGLMVDAGRQYFSLPWLRDRIRDMAYLKMNYLHLHLSDNAGFRLESTVHPEIVSSKRYTKQEMTDLIAYAARYHVQVVPEIDFPGHARAVLARHPELRLKDDDGTVHDDLIDLSNPAAYPFMSDIINEYLPLFPAKYWHIGADEYLTDYTKYTNLKTYAQQKYGPDATAKDAYYGFFNWADTIVRAGGKTTRAWNDGLFPDDGTVQVNPDIVIDYWSAGSTFPWIGNAHTATALVAQGHQVQNSSFTPTYYNTAPLLKPLTAPAALMYDAWNPARFIGGTQVTDPVSNLGAKLSVWSDDANSETEQTIATNIHDRLRVMAQHTWGSPKPDLLYALFALRIGKVGDAPA